MSGPHPPLLMLQLVAATTRLVRLIEPWDPTLAVQARAKIPLLVAHVEGLVPNSARYYTGLISDWVDWLDQLPLNGAPTAPAVLEAYFHWKANEGSRPSYQRVRTSLITIVLRTLGLLDDQARDVLHRLRRVNQPDPCRLAPKALPNDFLQRLESSTDLNDPVEVGDTALVILLSETLLRPMAILGYYTLGTWSRLPAQVSDLVERSDGTGRLRLRPIKSGRATKAESVAVSHLAMKWLKLWLRCLDGTPGPLFRTSLGSPLSMQSLQGTRRRVGHRTGLGRRLSLMALRRLTASHMLAAGIDVAHVDSAFRAHGMRERSWLAPKRSPARVTADDTLRDFARRRGLNTRRVVDCQPPQLVLFS